MVKRTGIPPKATNRIQPVKKRFPKTSASQFALQPSTRGFVTWKLPDNTATWRTGRKKEL